MQGLRTVVYMCEDLTKARDWYSKAFKAEPSYDTPYYVGFNIGGYELGLHPVEGEPKVKGNSTTVYWGVEELEAEYQRLINLGATPCDKIQNVGGAISLGSVKDPWGNIIGLIHNPEFKAEQ